MSQNTLQTIQITLRRHQSTGFGFRPARGVGTEPIVASVINGKLITKCVSGPDNLMKIIFLIFEILDFLLKNLFVDRC